MKRIALSTLSLALLGVTGVAHAQSSVTLYGLIDESVQYVNNATPVGGHVFQLFSGNLQGSRFGLKGSEDLGGGLKAIFQLENGFNVNNGKMGSYGYNGTSLLFGRQAYVGLSHDAYGTFTAGRQYDPLVDMVQPLTGDNFFGSTFATPGDVDNNDNSSRTSNALKYVSPVFAGFQFEGLYALGGVAGQTGSGQTWGAAGTYANGPFSVAGGYLSMSNNHATALVRTTGWGGTSDGMFDSNFPTSAGINAAYATASRIGIGSVSVQYVTGPWTGNLSYSNAQYYHDGSSTFGQTQKYEVGRAYLGYQLTPAALLGVGYAYTKGHGDASATYHQVSLGGDYSLSKRTDLYLVGAWQHASGEQRTPGVGGGLESATASIGSYGNQSSTDKQVMVSLGIRHKF
ncbi:Outer membrane porin protein [Paraburkholderia ultramafica]|uniref:Outer membrane porin protein n=1 Tax=Paraburkholderia ultramafica TaxID=1544867 RepID=A0A6S7B379_9BURK|nr:porin [Paraburkholderia ultramafica]CAB3778436.1 Outer membrane porin protein [Paraburkholderia ultramafica]